MVAKQKIHDYAPFLQKLRIGHHIDSGPLCGDGTSTLSSAIIEVWRGRGVTMLPIIRSARPELVTKGSL